MKKRGSIFGRKNSGSGKPAWGDSGAMEVVGEGHFWKKGQSLPRTWRRRDYKLREDAVLFYFDGDKLKGSVDVTDITLSPGQDKNLGRSGAAPVGGDSAIAAELFSAVEDKTVELVFDGKASADKFCLLLMKVTTSTTAVEKFVRDFHWLEANRLLGAEELEQDNEDESRCGTTLTSASCDIPDGKMSWEEGAALQVLGEGEFWKKGQRVKNWKRRQYRIREDGLLFYFEAGKSKPKGGRDLSTVSLRIGRGTNLADSGAVDFSVEEAVPVELRFDEQANRFMEVVFDSVSTCRMFALAVSKVASSHNTSDFLSELQAPDNIPKYDESAVHHRPRRGSVLGGTDGECLIQGPWLKRGRVRNVMKKREFKIVWRKEGTVAGPLASKATFEYLFGDNGYFKKTIDIYHIYLRFEPGSSACADSLDFSSGEIVPMEVLFLNSPIDTVKAAVGGPPASCVDLALPFALEGISAVEKFCDAIETASLSTNAVEFLAEVKAKPISRTPAAHTLSPASPPQQALPSMQPPGPLSAPSSTEYTVVYEGVFIKKTRVMNSWKSRGFKLKKSVGAPDGEGYAQLEFKGFGAFSTKLDVSDVTLTLKDTNARIDGGDGEYTQFAITSNVEKISIDVAMFGSHDIDVFCGYLAKLCRAHNIPTFLSDFHESPQGRKRKVVHTYLSGTCLRQGLRTGTWKRKHYRICRVVDSTLEPQCEYGVLQFGPENTKPSEWRGYIMLTNITVTVDSSLCAGSDSIVIIANDASQSPVDENHRRLILILDPHGCNEGPAARREREGGHEEDESESSGDESDGEEAPPTILRDGDSRRERPTVEEVCCFLKAIAARSTHSNAEALATDFSSRRGRNGIGRGKAAVLFYICCGMFMFSCMWVFLMPSVSSLVVFTLCIGVLGVFISHSFSTRAKSASVRKNNGGG